MTIPDRLSAIVITLCRICVGLSFAVLIAAVLIQVTGRLIGSSPVWTEELTRFALLYLVAFGAGLSFRSGDLVNVDVVCESLPGRWPWLLRLISAGLTAGLSLFLLVSAWRFVTIGMSASPALGFRMAYAHLTVWLLLALLGLFALLRVIGMLSGTSNGLPEKPEEG